MLGHTVLLKKLFLNSESLSWSDCLESKSLPLLFQMPAYYILQAEILMCEQLNSTGE